MSYNVNQQSRVLTNIFDLFEKEGVLSEHGDNYEEFGVIRHTPDISRLVKNKCISASDRQAALVSMAVMYVNMCLLHIKCNLSSSECKNYLVYFCLQDFDLEPDFAWTEVFFTKHADKVHLEHKDEQIDIKECELYEKIKNVIGLSDFNCYYHKSNEYNERYYAFVPKALSHLII